MSRDFDNSQVVPISAVWQIASPAGEKEGGHAAAAFACGFAELERLRYERVDGADADTERQSERISLIVKKKKLHLFTDQHALCQDRRQLDGMLVIVAGEHIAVRAQFKVAVGVEMVNSASPFVFGLAEPPPKFRWT
jgi:hypothetical protein